MNIKFSERLKNLRKEKGLSQAELANALNLTQRKISYLETGKFEPDLKILWDVSSYFEVSCDYLIGKSEY